jgi:hypothetical protein
LKLEDTEKLIGKDPTQAIQNYQIISASIIASKDRDVRLMEKYGYSEAQLTNLCISVNDPNYTLHF